MRLPENSKRTNIGLLPAEWNVRPVAAVTENIIDYRGRTPKKLGMEWGGGDIPALSARNVRMGYIDLEQETYYGSESLYRRWMASGDPRQGDVVITLEAPLGNVAVIPDNRRYILSQRTILLQVDRDEAVSQFLYQVLTSSQFKQRLLENATGSTAKGIQRTRFEKLPVQVPPLPEQRAIAGALSDVDALIGALDAAVAKKRAIKLATMQQLLTGKTRLPGFSDEWTRKVLGDFASIRNVKIMPRQVAPDTPCVELEHIGQRDGRLLGYSTARSSTSSKYRFERGDVLFGRLRSYLRKYWHADRDGICTTEIWPLMVDTSQASSGFLRGVVETKSFIDVASVSYGTHMPRADWGVVRNFEVSLPPLKEQTAIASVLSDMDAEITALEQRRDKTKAIKQGMMQSLLTGRVRLVEPETTP